MMIGIRFVVASLLLSLQFLLAAQSGICAQTMPLLLPQHKENYLAEATLGHPNIWFPKDMPLRVFFNPPKAVRNYQPYMSDVFKNCLKEYERVSAGKIRFVVVDKGPYDIQVNFSSKLLPGANRWDAGWTTVQTSPHHIDRANITVFTHTKSWLEKDYLREVCTHELGHALGLHNHSPDPHDVMYSTCMIIPQVMTIRDVNTLGMLYSFKPSDAVVANLPEYCEHISTALPRHFSQAQADDYCQKVSAKMNLSKWLAAGTKQRSCDLSLLLDGSGNIYNYRITRRSGSIAFDNSILTALVTSIPLPKPPDGILSKAPSGSRRILFSFSVASDGQIAALPVSDEQSGEIIPCAQAVPPLTLISGQQVVPERQTSSECDSSILASGRAPLATLNKTPQQLDDLEWVAKVKQLAKDRWQPDEPGNVVLCLGIKQDGKIAHLAVKQSLSDVAFMRAAMDSCLMAEPYPVPPGTGDFVKEVEINFDGASSP